MTVLHKRCRRRHSDNFVIREKKFSFYVVHSKVVINNRLRMSAGDIIVIKYSEDNDGFRAMTVIVLHILKLG